MSVGLIWWACAFCLFTFEKYTQAKEDFIQLHFLFGMSAENFRFYIKVRTALNIPSWTIHEELNSVYGDQAPSLRTVERWFKLFREGREETEDKPRSGRPITESTSDNIERIRLLIDDDPYLTIEELEYETGLSHGTIHRIIADQLNLRKITSRYVPKDLTDFQRAERVRICKENLAILRYNNRRRIVVLP